MCNKKLIRTITMFLFVLFIVREFDMVAFAQGKKVSPSGRYYEFSEKENYPISNSGNGVATTVKNTIGSFSISGNFKDEGNSVYYVQSGTVDVSYKVNSSLPETSDKKWNLTKDTANTVDDIKLGSNILVGAVIIQSSLDAENWIVDKVYTDVFSNSDSLPDVLFSTKNIHQLNGCYYRVIVAYKLEKKVDPSPFLFWETDNSEYKRAAEVYTFFVIDQHTVDNGAASPQGKPRHEFSTVVNTGKDNGYDVTQAKPMDKDDPHFTKSIGYFTVNGYTRETTENDGTIVFLKTVGDDVVLWFSLTQDIDNLFGKNNLSIAEDKSAYDKAMGVEQTNFKRGALIVKYTDEEGHSPETIKYFDFLAANTMTGADTRIQLYEEGDYEICLDYEICDSKGIPSYYDYKLAFKFAIRNGNTMAFPRDISTGSELKDGALTANGFKVDLAESKYLTVDVVRKEVVQNSDGTLSTSVRSNSVGKDGGTYTREGIYEITVKNSFSKGAPTPVTIYVGTGKNIRAIAINHLSVDALNEHIRNGYSIEDDGSLLPPKPLTTPEPSITEDNSEVSAELSKELLDEVPEESPNVQAAAAQESPSVKEERESQKEAPANGNVGSVAVPPEESKTHIPVAPIAGVGVAIVAVILFAVNKKKQRRNKEDR